MSTISYQYPGRDYKYLYHVIDSEQTKPNKTYKTKPIKQEKSIKLNWLNKFSKQNLLTSAGNLFCWQASTKYKVAVSDYNLVFIFIVEQATKKGVNLKNDHIMTDKSNCSQPQVIFLTQSFDKVVPHNCTVVICRLVIYGGLKREIREKGRVEDFTPIDVKMI